MIWPTYHINYIRGEKVRLKHEVLAGLVAEREKEEDLVSALAKLHLPDTEAMEWNNKILPRAQEDHQDQQVSRYY